MTMSAKYTDRQIEEFLIGSGTPIENYFLEEGPYGTSVGYVDVNGQEFDWAIDDPVLAEETKFFLKRKNVKVIKLG